MMTSSEIRQAFLDFFTGQANVITKCFFKNNSINCNILLPAAEELGSTQTVPIIKSFFWINYSVLICCL